MHQCTDKGFCVFVCVCMCEDKGILVMTDPLVPTTNDGTHTETHFP